MTNERFNELINGPLDHPVPMFKIMRLMMALRVVVDAHPDADNALEAHCAEREAADSAEDLSL